MQASVRHRARRWWSSCVSTRAVDSRPTMEHQGRDVAKDKYEETLRSRLASGHLQVPWRHHPPEVRAAIRRAGFRPMARQCYANSQRLLLYGELDVEYWEVVVLLRGS